MPKVNFVISMQARDWSRTPLGPAESWPSSLRTTVQIMLSSRYAMWLAWGPQLTFLCNDAYLPTLGVKQEWALGSPAEQVWAEIWPDIGPRIHSVLRTGKATWDEDLLLVLERSGVPEETFHTFSYSPVFDDQGRVAGMLCVVTEETDRVLAQRRMGFLNQLALALSQRRTTQEVLQAVQECLECQGPPDLPGLGIYQTAPGLEPLLEIRVSIAPDLRTEIEFLKPFVVNESLCCALPLEEELLLVVGLNRLRFLDEDYHNFLKLLGGQIGAAWRGAKSYEFEKSRAESLAELARAKTLFFSNISHEFRTPLTLILGPLEELLLQSQGSSMKGQLEAVYRNARRL